MNVIAKLVSGSKLYGTAIAGSDTDFRGIYLPLPEECLLQKVKDTIEDKSEEDTTYFSLQRFMDLAQQGQSIAIEMLATPAIQQNKTSNVFWRLQANKHRFYTKNMHAFLGFAKSMAGKYSSRVDRLNEVEAIMHVLQKDGRVRHKAALKLSSIWDELPISANAIKTVNERNTGVDNRVYQVCGRELQATITIEHAHSVVFDIYNSYGKRVRSAQNGEIEWKSMMHAFRVAIQAKEIVETGDLIYPLKDAAWLTQLRLGQIDFIKEGLDKRLDDLIIEVQEKMDKSNLPEKADTSWCEKFILEAYNVK